MRKQMINTEIRARTHTHISTGMQATNVSGTKKLK